MTADMFTRIALAAVMLTVAAISPAESNDSGLETRVLELVEQLDASRASLRLEAEDALAELGDEKGAERVLAMLPDDSPTMPAGVRSALDRVRLRLERMLAELATGPSRVTLQVAQRPLKEVLDAFAEQTGNRFLDQREAFGADEQEKRVTLTLEDEPFWPAVDRLLDAAKLGVYPYGEDGVLTLVGRGPGERSRHGQGAYAGPFRLEATSVTATRGLRDAATSGLDLTVEVAWEPRLRPIAISQPFSELTIVGPRETPLAPRMPEQSIELESSQGSQALDMTIGLVLPEPRIDRIESIQGRLYAMIPATKREFRVEKIGQAATPITQSFGDATVTLQRFTKQNAIWELHLRLRLENAGDSLASHRGWVFQNTCYLVDSEGKRIEHAGFETTMQTESEVGIAYLFDLSGEAIFDFGAANNAWDAEPEEAKAADPNELTWVYETPSGVYTVPVDWELGPIELP